MDSCRFREIRFVFSLVLKERAGYRRRLCRRLIGIFDPIVRGGPGIVTGCCEDEDDDDDDEDVVDALDPDGEYARS